MVPRDHRESPRALRRRQLVTSGFLVLGAVVLALSLRIEPGSPGSTRPPSRWPRSGRSAPSPPARCTWAGSCTPRGRAGRCVTPILARRCCWPGSSSSAASWCARSRSWTSRCAACSTTPTRARAAARAGHGGQRRRRGAVLPGGRATPPRPAAPGAGDHRGLRRGDPGHRQRDAGLRRRCCSAPSSGWSAGPPAASWRRS